MTTDRPSPNLTPQAERDRQERLSREAQALRANLRRRKDQVRRRDETEPAPPQDNPAPTDP